MGNCCGNDKVQPEVRRFERFGDSPSEDSEDDYRKFSKSRSCTDIFFLLVMILFYIALAVLLIYCMINGDIWRLWNGYDQCGNICGKENSKESDPRLECKGQDMRKLPFLLITNASGKVVNESNVRKMCVSDCTTVPGYRQFINRCVPTSNEKVVNTFYSKTGIKNFFQEAAEDLSVSWREIVYLCLIALGFSLLLLLLFRFFVGIVVWFVLGAVVVATIVGTISLWVLYIRTKIKLDENADMTSDIDEQNKTTYLALAIIATVVTIIVVLIIFVMRKRIQLVVQLFREAGKAIAAVPLLLIEPLLTFISLVIVVTCWVYFSLWIQSSGRITYRAEKEYYYEKDITMKITRWYNVIAMIWIAEFVVACQHMVIAGAVATWYFTRDKSKLGKPLFRSFFNLVRYHLGSVALGSFIITIVQIVKLILAAVKSYLKDKTGKCVEYTLTCCQCCLSCLENILRYLSRNAYIEVAMYGQSFCSGGKQAFKLLVSNAFRVTVINSVGDFVLFLGKILVVVSTVLIGTEMLRYKEGLHHFWIPLTLAGLFAYFVAHCFMTVYEMCIDTIFLCFCEDCEQNDGITKPYYMSKNLMEFVENSKKALNYVESPRKEQSQAWQRPATISDKVDQ